MCVCAYSFDVPACGMSVCNWITFYVQPANEFGIGFFLGKGLFFYPLRWFDLIWFDFGLKVQIAQFSLDINLNSLSEAARPRQFNYLVACVDDSMSISAAHNCKYIEREKTRRYSLVHSCWKWFFANSKMCKYYVIW